MPDIIGVSGVSRRTDFIPESLRGKISLTEMGSRTNRSAPQLESYDSNKAKNNSLTNLEAFVFKIFSDVNVDVINSVVEILLTIFNSTESSDEEKKSESEELIGKTLNTSDFDELRLLCRKVIESSLDEENAEDLMEDLESENDGDDMVDVDNSATDNNASTFVALNDPIRFRNSVKVNPSDIDSHWLENVLKGTNVEAKTLMEVLEKYVLKNRTEQDDDELRNLFSLDDFNVYQTISMNMDIIYWYTKMAWASTGDERDEILDVINSKGLSLESLNEEENVMNDVPQEVDLRVTGIPLQSIRFMTVPGHSAKLPQGSTRFTTKNYEQYNVPASTDSTVVPDWPIVEVETLPDFARSAFDGIKVLNVVQSKVCDTMIKDDKNVLLCAPTGAGKSNVALLAITKCLNDGFKCICIAPLKALVQEQVSTLQRKLGSFKVSELSGDQALSRRQLLSVDVIVTTPEKWDVVSRKSTNIELLRTIGLVVIDEIHLLNDEVRGPVLENIVIRHKRQPFPPRLVGLSATLPNYNDVGEFLGVSEPCLFYFDARFRPVPLEQKYIGVTAKSPIKQLNAINEACLEKVQEIVINENKQVLIFVQSRKETTTTRNLILERFKNDKAFPFGVGVHHAGLSRELRETAETQFKEGSIRVLVSTATLAWGVNLPAAAVIIKGTEFYDPTKSGWTQLSPQDVLQMLGRAGRPGFDTEGIGIIITAHKYLNYFASVAMMELPIESFLVKRLCDSLNAEVCSRTVRNIDDCIEWIKKSFWYVRYKSNPDVYGDTYTVADIVHSALIWLKNYNSISYNFPDTIKPTYLGDVAAKFYISPQSAFIYSQQLKSWLCDIDVIRVFSRSVEFSSLPVRQNEIKEVARLASLLPIPIRDAIDSRYAKVAVMLQAYISRLRLLGLALSSDVVYVAQSASRLFRAIFELSLVARWGKLAQIAHELYLMVDRRQWGVGQTPLRQFPQCSVEIIKRIESSRIPWQRYLDLKKDELANVLHISDTLLVNEAYSYLQKFPKFRLNTSVQPITKSWLLVTVDLFPLYNYKEDSGVEFYWLIVETNGGEILYYTSIPQSKLVPTYKSSIPVKMENIYGDKFASPYLFVRLLSDKWLHFKCDAAINLRTIKPPLKESDANDILVEDDLEDGKEVTNFLQNPSKLLSMLFPLLTSHRKSIYIGMFPNKTYYDCIQVVLDAAHELGENVLLISAQPKILGSYLTLRDNVELRDVFEAERDSRVSSKIGEFSSIGCVICEGLHSVGSRYGYYYEALVTRLRIALGKSARFVGFGYPVTSATSLGQWLGAKKSDIFNFGFDSFPDLPLIELFRTGESLIVSLWDIIPKIDTESGTNVIIVGSYSECVIVREELKLFNFKDVSIMTHISDDISYNSGGIIICTRHQLSQRSSAKTDNLFVLMQSFSLSLVDLLSLTLHAKKRVTIVAEMQDYYASFINSPIPLESSVDKSIGDVIIPEIVKNNIRNPQDAVNWLMSTFLFKRLRQNPSYYHCDDIQDWLSELVESTFEKLSSIGAIEILDEESLDIEPGLLSHTLVNRAVSVEIFQNKRPISVYNRQSWLSDFTSNLFNLRGLDAKIDIAIANNNLDELFDLFDQRQYLVQSLPLGSSPLCQIPWVDSEVALRCQDANIPSIQDFMAIEDDNLRSTLLGFDNDNPKMIDVAEFVNNFPVVDITSVEMGDDNKTVSIDLERDMEPDEPITVHAAEGFPENLDENWYILGANENKNILFFDRIEVKEPVTTLSYTLNPALLGERITVWLICGSYIEADKQLTIEM